MPLLVKRLVCCALGAFMFATASCTTPKAQAAIAQELSDAATAIDGLRNDVSQLQTDVDSLRAVVVKQDSILNRITATMPR